MSDKRQSRISFDALVDRFYHPHSNASDEYAISLGLSPDELEIARQMFQGMPTIPMWLIVQSKIVPNTESEGWLRWQHGGVYVYVATQELVLSWKQMWALIEKRTHGELRSPAQVADGVPTPEELDAMFEPVATQNLNPRAPSHWRAWEVTSSIMLVFDGSDTVVVSKSNYHPATFEELDAWLKARNVKVANVNELSGQAERR